MGEVLATATQKYGKSAREAVAILSRALKQKEFLSVREALLPSPYLQRGYGSECTDTEVIAWSIVAMWLTGVATKNLHNSATLREAEEWFLSKDSDVRLTDILSASEVAEAGTVLQCGMDPDTCLNQFPYILDSHGPGSRLSVMRDPETRASRARKRADGVFYTPTDVAEYMVGNCLDSLDVDSCPKVLDPACGTGVFLRVALQELRRRNKDRSAFSLAVECLFGTDIAPWPLNASAFVLLTDIIGCDQEQQGVPVDLWRRLRTNLGCIDALLVEPADKGPGSTDTLHNDTERLSLTDLFPAIQDGPTVIVGNPPYADLGESPYLGKLVRSFKTLSVKPTPTAEIYVAFVEQMVRLANQTHCAGSLVVPLSVACNIGPQFAAVRQLIQGTAGEWRFAFFDREPQALFGEDVKTRNAIIFWNRDASSENSVLSSGPLRRWRGEHRAAMFDSIGFTQISGDIRRGIPKIEGCGQVSALETLNARWDRLEQAVNNVNRLSLADTADAGDAVLFVGNTAYNFLNVFLRPPQQVFRSEHQLSENQLYAIQCESPEDALAIFGILSSHLAYWWWLTHGDGFHVTRRFITNFPFGSEVLGGQYRDVLSEYGSALWSTMNSNPTISLNRGRTSVAYSPIRYADLRRSVDRVLLDAAGLDYRFADELQRFSEQTIAAQPGCRSHR